MIISHLRDFNSRHQITGSAKRLEKLSALNEPLKKKKTLKNSAAHQAADLTLLTRSL